MRPLLVLRPEPGASATAAAARELGLEAVVMPLFASEPLEWRAPDASRFDGLLLTSANALRHGGAEMQKLASLPAHCVGEATAAAARAAGLHVATVGHEGVDSLLQSLSPNLKLLHLCGRDRREPGHAAQSIAAILVYAAMEVEPAGRLASAEGSVVLVHSPRAAARFDTLASDAALDRRTIAIAAISDDAAAAAGAGWECVEAAAGTSDTALLALASRLCNKPARWTGAEKAK